MGETTKVQKNFSVCDVHVSESGGESEAYAGGIVGYRANGDLNNNAALGVLVFAKSDGTKNAGRIYGYPSTSIGEDNYALSSMYVGTESYGGADPTTTNSSTDATSFQGKTASLSDFRKTDIWVDDDKLAFNLVENPRDMYNVMVNAWDFSNLSGLGYPKLVGE